MFGFRPCADLCQASNEDGHDLHLHEYEINKISVLGPCVGDPIFIMTLVNATKFASSAENIFLRTGCG